LFLTTNKTILANSIALAFVALPTAVGAERGRSTAQSSLLSLVWSVCLSIKSKDNAYWERGPFKSSNKCELWCLLSSLVSRIRKGTWKLWGITQQRQRLSCILFLF